MSIPANGTRAAVTYWAMRTREALRVSALFLDAKDASTAIETALEAAGAASEYHQAAAAYLDHNLESHPDA